MSVSFNGFDEKLLTFKTNAVIDAGSPVTVTDNATVGASESGDLFCGVCVGSDGSYCAVKIRGTVTVPYTGDTPTVGRTGLLADGEGGVFCDDDGEMYLVLSVDSTAETVTFIL